MTWHDEETARDEWESAPTNDDVLTQLLEVSKQQVIAYAPKLAEDAAVPVNYRYGQLEQAKNLYNASSVDSSGGMGEGEFVMRPHPLDWIIKQILRPKRAVPRVR